MIFLDPLKKEILIKYIPEDFKVEERIDFSNKQYGENFLYFKLYKKNLNTHEAIRKVSKFFKISKKRIFFAGVKDKHAVTTQIIAIKSGKNINIEDLEINKKIKIRDNLYLEYIGAFKDPVGISDIIGNFFEIIIRKVNTNYLKILNENYEIVKKYIVNYYDYQRFGDKRSINHLVGKCLLKKQWEEAVKILLTYTSNKESKTSREARLFLKYNWGNFLEAYKKFPDYLDIEKKILEVLIKKHDYKKAINNIERRLLRLLVHSYQSYLYNKICKAYLETKYVSKKYITICDEKYPFPTYIDNEDFDLEILVPGYDLKSKLKSYKNDLIKKIIIDILKEENIKIEDFIFKEGQIKTLTSESFFRPLFIKPKIENIEISEDEIFKGYKKIKISFFLPKGSYATIFIKSLFVY